MWPFLLTACALYGDAVDHQALEAAAQRHHDAVAAAAPHGGSCDGLASILAGESPRGCRYRPASSLAEAGAVAARCAQLLDDPGDGEAAAVVGLYGAWAATPVSLSTCATLVGARGTPELRRQLPTDVIAVHGARWGAWLALEGASADDTALRGWETVEAACRDPLAPACLSALGEGGPVTTRVAIEEVLNALRAGRADPAPI